MLLPTNTEMVLSVSLKHSQRVADENILSHHDATDISAKRFV